MPAEMGNQSPIDIDDSVVSDAAAPISAYASDAVQVERVHGVPMIHFAPGSELQVADHRFRLLQLHWHTPAEHTIAGEEFAAELHLVHQNEQQELLVVGRVYRLGEANDSIQRVIDETPPAGAEADVVPALSAEAYAVSDGFFHYTGSLTAPPFSEPVQWYVSRRIRTVSLRQVEQLQALTNGPNARPLQDRNGRTILCVGCGV